MGILDQIMQMKNQGMSDNEILVNLQQQGVSPREINNALNQFQIKNAVSGESEIPFPGEGQVRGDYAPSTQETYERTPKNAEQYSQPYAQQTQEFYPQGAYGGYQSAEAYPTTTSTDTIIELAEQVFSEKIKNIQKQSDQMTEFKTLTQTKLDDLLERIKRMESMIDRLQITILEKISSYGKGFEQTKKEVEMIQDSFGKMVNKIADSSQQKVHHQAPSHHKAHSRKKS